MISREVKSHQARPLDAITLSDEQRARLADLVLLAQIGFSLIKSGPEVSESAHPAVAAFMPLVAEELEERKEKRRAEHRWDFDGDPL